jgi:SAM-dependent methyltransferase
LPYADPRIWDFMQTFYQGRIPAATKDGTYALLECTACGFIWQREILSAALSDALYEEWIDAAHSLEKREQAPPVFYHRLARSMGFVREVVGAGPKRVLDFGMGWGHWCMMANAYCLEAVGVEASARRVAYASAHGVRSVTHLEDVPDASVSFINADQVFEHIPQPLATLQKMTTLLAPGGTVHIAVPDGSETASHFARPDWTASKSPWQPLEHINTFTPKTLCALAERAGLRMVKLFPLPQALLRRAGTLLPDSLYLQVRKTSLYFQKIG